MSCGLDLPRPAGNFPIFLCDMAAALVLSPPTDKNAQVIQTLLDRCHTKLYPPLSTQDITNLTKFTAFHPIAAFSQLLNVIDTPVGLLLASCDNSNQIVIHCLSILPAFRRQRLGTYLLNNLFETIHILNGSTGQCENNTAGKLQQCKSGTEVVRFELKRNLKNAKRIPIRRVIIRIDRQNNCTDDRGDSMIESSVDFIRSFQKNNARDETYSETTSDNEFTFSWEFSMSMNRDSKA